jgi:Fe-S cluster assembly ATP-binding protein
MSQLEIKDLHVSIGEKAIVKGLQPDDQQRRSARHHGAQRHRQVHALQGDRRPPGLHDHERRCAARRPVHPRHGADERARAGLFLAFQYPSEIPGVSIANFLRAAVQARMAEGEEIDATAYYKRLYAKMDLLKIDRKFTARAVNDGFSGGEKEALRDPPDGDARAQVRPHGRDRLRPRHRRAPHRLRRRQRHARRPLGILLITHYQRLLDYIVPDFVHVMYDGRIVKSGDKSLALELEAKGYDWVKKELAAATA